MPKATIPVTERAVLARVNRSIAHQGRKLKKVPVHSKWYDSHGPYTLLNTDRNIHLGDNIDLEGYARELGVLAEWEGIAM